MEAPVSTRGRDRRHAGSASGAEAAGRRSSGGARAVCRHSRNAVVVRRLLAQRGVVVSERTIQRAVADLRRAQRAAALATVRMETATGEQLPIDFGQKRIAIAGVAVRVSLLVAVLSYSRRLFVKAPTNQLVTQWGTVFGDDVLAAAILDRLLHHSHT
jgi:DNA replication protein DnaC